MTKNESAKMRPITEELRSETKKAVQKAAADVHKTQVSKSENVLVEVRKDIQRDEVK